QIILPAQEHASSYTPLDRSGFVETEIHSAEVAKENVDLRERVIFHGGFDRFGRVVMRKDVNVFRNPRQLASDSFGRQDVINTSGSNSVSGHRIVFRRFV